MATTFVLLPAADPELLRQEVCRFAHDHLRQRAKKAVPVHGIDEDPVSEAIAPAGAVQKVGDLGHIFRAAGEDASFQNKVHLALNPAPEKPAKKAEN